MHKEKNLSVNLKGNPKLRRHFFGKFGLTSIKVLTCKKQNPLKFICFTYSTSPMSDTVFDKQNYLLSRRIQNYMR